MSLGPYREGLCGMREDHEPHLYNSKSLGIYWCTADQSKRQPYAAEKLCKEKS